MINVTKAFLPRKEKLIRYIDRLYETHWLTNNGENVRELESRLAEYLGVKYLVLTSNGTLALQLAYRALGLTGDVVTTPYSFVATVSSLVWEGLNPVFADIDVNSLNIAPENIERAITPQTSAVLGVHVYGRPCDVTEIEKIARKKNLKVIYDAAHAFAIRIHDKSVLNWGDASVLSFHATKVFHTVEGGAVITPHEDVYRKLKLLSNFGIQGPDHIGCLGINCKMNEIQAAMGLCVLDEIEGILLGRSRVATLYGQLLPTYVQLQPVPEASTNHSYFAILLSSEEAVIQMQTALSEAGVNTRRYFYPSLNTLSFVNYQECPISENIASRVLCLPMYPSLDDAAVRKIATIVRSLLK